MIIKNNPVDAHRKSAWAYWFAQTVLLVNRNIPMTPEEIWKCGVSIKLDEALDVKVNEPVKGLSRWLGYRCKPRNDRFSLVWPSIFKRKDGMFQLR